ncbi:MAG: alpha-glucosidase C-terminal domain-containing protein [Anaerolineales bacterium]
MGDNIWLFDRNGVRTPMQWDNTRNAGFSLAKPENLYAPVVELGEYTYEAVNVFDESKDPDSILNKMKHLVEVRKSNPIFAKGDYRFLALDQNELLVILREYLGEKLLCILNLTMNKQILRLNLTDLKDHQMIDLLNKNRYQGMDSENHTTFTVEPYEFLWLQIADL